MKVGDTVKLKGHGVLMTIIQDKLNIDNSSFLCAWYDEKKVLNTFEFSKECLFKE